MFPGFYRRSFFRACLVIAVAASGVIAWGDKPKDVEADAELSDIASWAAGRVITGASEQETRIRTALERPFTHTFEEATLAEVAKTLEKLLSCTVLLDQAALAADGLEGARISYRAQGRSLRSELRSMLAPRQLTAIVHDDSVTVTTLTGAETHLLVRVYQVHDLVVKRDDVTVLRPEFERLITLLMSHCGSEAWAEYGRLGGEMRPYVGPGILALVVWQTEETHGNIERLLAQLRAARLDELLQPVLAPREADSEDSENDCSQIGSGVPVVEAPSVPPPPPFPRGKVIYPLQTVAEQTIYRALRQPAEFDLPATRLDKFAALLAERYKFAVELDEYALTADGKGPELELTFRWRDGALRSALRQLLKQQGLTYVVADDALRLTTVTAAEVVEVTHVYQVNDLLALDMRRIVRPARFDELQELIYSVVAPETWREGNGSQIDIFGFEAPGIQVLAIEQTQPVHEEIEQLLAMLRAAYEPKVYEAQRRRPVVRPPEPVPAAVPGGGIF